MQYSRKHNLCIYDLGITKVDQLLQVLPDSICLDKGLIGVPCTLSNMQIMAGLGQEALSPILVDYDWPIMPGRKPLEHQKHMAAFMTLHPRCFNLSDMGTMKTLSVLWAWDYLMLKGVVKKVIIICTISTMVDVWQREITKNFLSRRKAVIVHGDRKRRAERLAENADFYIINHDGSSIGCSHKELGGNRTKFFPGPIAEYFAANPAINGVTVDEGSEYKHANTDSYKSLKHGLRHKPYFNWLTGTPTPKSPLEAYSQAKMVRLNYEESWTGFRERTMQKISTFQWKAKPEGYAIAASILQPSIRYDIEDCADLPECVQIERHAELSPAQTKAIKELKATLKTMVDGGKINAINEISLRTKLLQIASGAVYGENHIAHKVDCAPRLEVLKEVIEQSHHKVLVFASLTNVVDMLHSELGKEYTVEKVTGNVSISKRNEIFRNFRESENPRIIVAHPGTMAHGLDLTTADLTVWYAPTDDAEIYQQANRRMRRPGQKNTMRIVRIASTSTEREIYRRLDTSGSMQGVMLDLIRGE